MANIDYKAYAAALKVIPVWQKSAQNTSGFLTPPELYTPYTPFVENRQVIHATVGTNTLPYFAAKVDANWNVTQQAGSIRDGRQVCAHQLLPRDDYTIYDMVPAGFGCGHCNPGILKGQGALNFHARGYELENKQNGDAGEAFTDGQYIKLALTIAYHTAVAQPTKIRNIYIGTHFDATLNAILAGQEQPNQAHVDPYNGPFDQGQFYGHLFSIRQTANWPWPSIPLWDGR